MIFPHRQNQASIEKVEIVIIASFLEFVQEIVFIIVATQHMVHGKFIHIVWNIFRKSSNYYGAKE